MGIKITNTDAKKDSIYEDWNSALESPYTLFYDGNRDLIVLCSTEGQYVYFSRDRSFLEVLVDASIEFPLIPAHNVKVTISN